MSETKPREDAPVEQDELYLGDAIHFFLSAKRAGGRSKSTIDDYRKKLELFQRWAARRLGGEDAVDAPARTTSRSSRASSRPCAGG